MQLIMDMVQNQIVQSVALAWFLAHFVKFIIGSVKAKKMSPREFVALGGMPSAHSATVVALGLSILLFEGVSTAFVISVILALIVMRDALGVRAAVDAHSRMLLRGKNVRRVGHTIMEVAAGAGLGVLITLVVFSV